MLMAGFPPPGRRRGAYRSILLAAAILLLGVLPAAFLIPGPTEETYASAEVTPEPIPAAATPAAKLPGDLRKGLPEGWPLKDTIFSEETLWAGKLLLIDKDHPMPENAPPPNTLSIAAMGEGKIAVRSMAHVTDAQVIAALKELFDLGRGQGVTCWLVWEGSRSNAQQLALQMERLGQYAQAMPLAEAAERAAAEVSAPGESEHQLPYVADIRIARGFNVAPDQALLSESPEGRLLLDSAWRFGFIHRYGEKAAPPYQDEAYHFRYVGVAHSTVMRALGLNFEDYLTFLRGAGGITYYENGIPRYAVLAKPWEGSASFSLPEGCAYEGSMDNTGWAVAAVTFPENRE